ncbi:bis(5'-nucleosyl)-tetraphosphatase (symmetrical) YqeK [Heyndrickxia oleronia]|uniref:bis(5'-nucleosyl)-tetraphosphatase (symmetrical) YqeK n=1 Tax=Heyndrickxia oleronia TaxID=38875 RepID=UPI00203D653F|nr:bis(5'-nucleosyl)-tetraphosphatase (symmetrical) YqeK [Heyndrickxia oleronia]MCM3237074.1 bis(5'-nucleosyl)-tetraphosphatase (symmetrical) YqeK [Heyndrickxia oleronia]
MERNKALEIVAKQLTEKRYTHTLGVMETAIDLAILYEADEKKAELAAIFHDYAKFRPLEEMKKIIIEQKFDPLLLQYNPELWHAPVGAYLIQEEVGIKDVEIINAVRYHTSGRMNMTLLEKIIYLADYIEPGRQFPGVEEARKLAKKDLDEALIYSVKNTIIFLMNKNQAVYPDTFTFYNDLVMKKERYVYGE